MMIRSIILLTAANCLGCGDDGKSTAPIAATDSVASSDGSDASTDVRDTAPSDATCKDQRKFGDYKLPGDLCWEPPKHYCSQGAGSALTKACNGDGSVCCVFPTTCVPCGWGLCENCRDGVPCKPAACGTAPVSTDATICHMPDPAKVICWD